MASKELSKQSWSMLRHFLLGLRPLAGSWLHLLTEIQRYLVRKNRFFRLMLIINLLWRFKFLKGNGLWQSMYVWVCVPFLGTLWVVRNAKKYVFKKCGKLLKWNMTWLFQITFWNKFQLSRLKMHICEEKIIFLLFLTQKSPLNHLTGRQSIQKVQKWCLVVKVLRENMRDVLFLDPFNQANFKYTPKKDFHMENFYCPVSTSAWLWNLEFAPKNWNPETFELLLRAQRHNAGQYVILVYFLAFLNCTFAVLIRILCILGQAEIKQSSNHSIKIHHMAIFFGYI